jgi:hypothetical protein
MKRRWLIIPFLTLALILSFTLLPISLISANPGNLVKNGDFSDGLSDWITSGNVNVIDEEAELGPDYGSTIKQYINSDNKNLIYSFKIKPITYNSSGSIYVDFELYKMGSFLGYVRHFYNTLQLNKWTSISYKISDAWYDYWGYEIPEFDEISIYAVVKKYGIANFDNFSLKEPDGETAELEEKPWVRDHEMTCWQVWVNQDDAFEFIFVWEYYNNNHVQIFDMNGNLVFTTDMKKGDAHFVAALPDGMYTVKTFHEAGHILQEFVIGKP